LKGRRRDEHLMVLGRENMVVVAGSLMSDGK
jgi:hypothetical protein